MEKVFPSGINSASTPLALLRVLVVEGELVFPGGHFVLWFRRGWVSSPIPTSTLLRLD